MTQWSREDILQFLNEVHARPELWDVEDSVYKDRNAKQKSWGVVAAQFGITAAEAYNKLRNLRTYANNEHKKMKMGGKHVVWFAYDAISFILPKNVADTTDSENTSEPSILNQTKIKVERFDSNDTSAEEDEDDQFVIKQPKSHKRSRSSRTEISEDTLDPGPSSSGKRKNPCSSFGDHIANKLSTYSSYTRAQVEFQISKILYDADMGLMSKPEEF